MSDSLDFLLACQICLEDFEETGDHVPRILPCSHTLCEKCLKQLIKPSNQGDKIECPECRKKHAVVGGVKTFPQNKYILTNIRRKYRTGNGKNIEKCPEHGKDFILFCKRPDCQKPICQACISKYHRGHDVVDIDEVKKEMKGIIQSKIRLAKEDLQRKRSKISSVKIETENKSETCISELTAQKDEILKQVSQQFDRMINKAKIQKLLTDTKTSRELQTIDKLKVHLDNITIEHEDSETIIHEGLARNLETVNEITERVATDLPRSEKYHFSQFMKKKSGNPIHMEQLCGCIEVKDNSVDFGPTGN